MLDGYRMTVGQTIHFSGTVAEAEDTPTANPARNESQHELMHVSTATPLATSWLTRQFTGVALRQHVGEHGISATVHLGRLATSIGNLSLEVAGGQRRRLQTMALP